MEPNASPGKEDLHRLISFLDLTSLDGTDNSGRIRSLCAKARSFGDKGLPLPAAVCVYPVFIRLVKAELTGTGIRAASVAGAFPSGQSPLEIRLQEIRYAIDEGADEIDMVISRGKLLEGDESFVFDEIAAGRETAGHALLKVILETGELKSDELIKKVSDIAIRAGADFIKTSTGKIIPAATPQAVGVMLETIREHYRVTGKRTGIKPAGGISDTTTASGYCTMVGEVLGNEWLTPSLFRIGASRLADKIVTALEK